MTEQEKRLLAEREDCFISWLLGGCCILGCCFLFALICVFRFQTLSVPILVLSGLFVVGGTVALMHFNGVKALAICALVVVLGFATEYLNVSYLQPSSFQGGDLVCHDHSSGKLYRHGGEWVFGHPGSLTCLRSEFGEHGIVNGAKFYAIFQSNFNVSDAELKERIDFFADYIGRFAYKYSDFNSAQFANHEKALPKLQSDFPDQSGLHERIRKCVAEVLTYYPVEARELEFPAGIPKDYSHVPARSVFGRDSGIVIFDDETLRQCDFSADGLTWQSLMLRKGGAQDE